MDKTRELFLKKGRQISNVTQCGVDTERTDGILQRSWVAGVTPAEIIIAQIATQLLILVCQTAIGLIFAILVFGIEVRGSIGVVILLTLLQGFGGMSFGKQNLYLSASHISLRQNSTKLSHDSKKR